MASKNIAVIVTGATSGIGLATSRPPSLPATADKADWIDVAGRRTNVQRSSVASVEDVRAAEQIAEIRRWPVGGRDRKQH
jgi:NAD(P)-dependent dehydrogenase (short-subunit alcohol dehydrogenase family)